MPTRPYALGYTLPRAAQEHPVGRLLRNFVAVVARRSPTNEWKGLAVGLVGGLLATWVMTRAQGAWREAEKTVRPPAARPDQGHPQSQHERGGPATEKIADRIAERVVHHRLPPEQRSLGGNLVHYAFGTLTGAVYGMIAEAVPQAGVGLGLPFGAALWVAADNVAVPAVGLSEPPTKQPPSMLVYGLSTHLVYGFALELTRRLLRRVL